MLEPSALALMKPKNKGLRDQSVVRVRPRTRRRLGVLLVSFAVLLLVLEGAVRVRQWAKYGATFTFYHLEHHEASGLEIPKPGDVSGPVRINSLGFRGPEIERPKPDGRLRLAFLGGSTTFCAEVSSELESWPHLVTRGLANDNPQVGFDYVNGGAAGYSTTESSLNLEHRVAPLEPDVIVIYHATNDLTKDTRLLATTQGLYEVEEDQGSWLGDRWLTYHLLEKNLKFLSRKKKGEGEGRPFEYDAASTSKSFERRLGELIDDAKAVAPVVAVATFSNQARPEHSPERQREACSSSLFYMPFMSVPGILEGFAEYNRVIRRVAAEKGVLVIEGENDIPGDLTHFTDSVHFTDAGSRKMAARVLTALRSSPEIRALIEAKENEALFLSPKSKVGRAEEAPTDDPALSGLGMTR